MAVPLVQLDPQLVEAEVVSLLRQLLREMGRADAAATVSPQTNLKVDLGLGSLELAELLLECERRFGVRLPERAVHELETPAAWAQLISEETREIPPPPGYRIPPPPTEGLPLPTSARTLVDVLVQHAHADPGRVHAHILEKDSGLALTYGQLYEDATTVAGALAEAGLERNDVVGIILPNGPEFLSSFLGVQLAGGIPVPLHPPTRPERIEEYVQRQLRVLRRIDIRFLISVREARPLIYLFRANLPHLADVLDGDQIRRTRLRVGPGTVRPSEIAVLQLTSGTTADPKAVVIRHENLLANLRAIGEAVEIRPGDALVSWLPLYSDLGLIGCWLVSLYYAIPFTLLSPLEFLQRPERWLWAIHDSLGTLSAGPNFAYELCTRRIPSWALEGLDLSCWRVAVNGAEPVLPETLEGFIRRFQPYGFRPEALMPAYGLAEATVALTIPPLGRGPVKDRVRRDRFEREGLAEPATAADRTVLEFVSLGRPVTGQQLRIVDEQGRPLPERRIGRLQFRGPCTMQGYYRDPEATRAVMDEDGWVDTGDYGYLAAGEFYFTGRLKDVIARAGRTVSPFDVEAALGNLPGVLPGSAVIFTAPDPQGVGEQLVVVAETRAITQEDFRRIEAEIFRLAESLLGMSPDAVRLVEPGTLPRTPNGKIRRNEIRLLWTRGRLQPVRRPQWWQWVRLWWGNLLPLTRLVAQRFLMRLGQTARAALTILAAYASGTWVRIVGSPHVACQAARWILQLKRCRYRIQGVERIDRQAPALLVANRASQLDALVLCAGLPGRVQFTDVAALNGLDSCLRYMLEPLVAGFGQRDLVPVARRLRQRVGDQLVPGNVLVAFPDSPPGAPPRYHLDIFRAAVDMGARIYPVTVRQRARRRNPVKPNQPWKVTLAVVREPVSWPGEVDFRQLRERVRSAIGGDNG